MSFARRILSTLWNSVAGHVGGWAKLVLRFLWDFFAQKNRCKKVLRSLLDRVQKLQENPDQRPVFRLALNCHQFIHRQFGRHEPITSEIDSLRERLYAREDTPAVDDRIMKGELSRLEDILKVALQRLEDSNAKVTGRVWDKAWARAPLALAISASIAVNLAINVDLGGDGPGPCGPGEIVEIDESTGVASCVRPPTLTPTLTPTPAPTPTPTSTTTPTPIPPAPPERLEECPTMSRMDYPFCYVVAPGDNPSQIIADHLRNYPELEAVSDCDIEDKIEPSWRLLLSENAREGAIINTGDFIVITKPVCPDQVKAPPLPLPFYLDDFVSRFRTALETALREPSDQTKAALITYADDDSGDTVVEFIDAFTSKNPLRGRNCLILDDVYRAIVEQGDGYHEIWLVLSAAVEFPDGRARPLRRENPPILVRLLLHHDGSTIIADVEVHDNHPNITFRTDSICPAT